MSFTERDFNLLNEEDGLKKIVYAVNQYLSGIKSLDYIVSLIGWHNKKYSAFIDIPDNTAGWKKLYKMLYGRLLELNPYLEDEIFDGRKEADESERFDMAVIIDNVRSPFNAGSIIRTCHALGVKELFLCGITPRSDDKQVLKTSRGVVIKTSYSAATPDAVGFLKNQGFKIFAVEKTRNSFGINECLFSGKCALILGNEEFGISKTVLEMCDGIFHIPMYARKRSINVGVAAGIAVYEIIKNKTFFLRANFQ